MEKGGEVDYVDPVTGETVRATIVGFDADGNAMLKFKDPNRAPATVKKDDIGNTIKGAPKRMATLYTNPNEGGKLDDAKKKGGGGGGGGGGGSKDKKGGGGGGGTSEADKAKAEKEKADKAAAAEKAKADKANQAEQDKAAKAAQQAADKTDRENKAAERTAKADQARADRKAAADAKEAQRQADRTPVLPSDMTEGSKVSIDGKDGDWTVQAVKHAPNGTIVVDIVGPDGKVESNYPISGPNGKRMTQGQLKIRPVK